VRPDCQGPPPRDKGPGPTSGNIGAGQALTPAVGMLQAMGAGGAASGGRQPGGPRHERGAGAAAGEAPLPLPLCSVTSTCSPG
jgi:hypothetical protein